MIEIFGLHHNFKLVLYSIFSTLVRHCIQYWILDFAHCFPPQCELGLLSFVNIHISVKNFFDLKASQVFEPEYEDKLKRSRDDLPTALVEHVIIILKCRSSTDID